MIELGLIAGRLALVWPRWLSRYAAGAMAALLSLPAYAADGGTFDAPTYAACEEWRADAGQAVQLDGGAWLVPDRNFRLEACRLGACAAQQPPDVAQAVPGAVVVGAVVGTVLGFIAGAVLVWKYGPAH